MWTAAWHSEFRISTIASHCARPVLWCRNCTSGSSCWLVVRCIAHIRITGRQWWWATNPFTPKAEDRWRWKSFTMPLWPDSFNSTDRDWAGCRAVQKSWLWNGMGKFSQHWLACSLAKCRSVSPSMCGDGASPTELGLCIVSFFSPSPGMETHEKGLKSSRMIGILPYSLVLCVIW